MGQTVAATRLRKIKFCIQTVIYSSSCAMQGTTLQRQQLYFSPVYFVAMVLMAFGENFRRNWIQNINLIMCLCGCEREAVVEESVVKI
jgi:uncharacterized membrane protein